MKRLGKIACNAWSARIESYIDAMQRMYDKGSVDAIEELNIDVRPLFDLRTVHKGEVIEVISANNKYAEALRNHPLCTYIQIGELNIKGNIADYYLVSLEAGRVVPSHLLKSMAEVWVPTNISSVEFILQQMEVTEDSYLCDAGAGDCRVGYISKCRTVCIERNPELVRTAYAWAQWFSGYNMEIINDDLYTHDYSEYTHIFMSLTHHDPKKLSKMLAGKVSKDTKLFTFLNPLDQSVFEITKAFVFVGNDSQVLPITVGLIQKLK
ncbi:MAG: hypothetical protein KAT43_00935 [Nanoarchaeota archaeon]|nr:hypothetical protein [Nanoarchaeota archaeon]